MKPTTDKISRVIKLLSGIFLLVLLFRSAWFLFSMQYEEYYKYFLKQVYVVSALKYINTPFIKVLFYIARGAFLSAALFLVFRLYRTLVYDKSLFLKEENTFFNGIATALVENAGYIKNLGRQNLLILSAILLIQLSSLTYLVITLPYHTDEAFSYLYFSGKGLISTIVYYPQPNNHVFYNIISGLMLALPVDPFIAIRLPTLLIGLFSTYYFFKTANKLLPIKVSLVATTLFTFSFPFIFYSFLARGYGFTLFFSLMLFYAFINITQGNNIKKYLTVYTVCSILGLYTIPTFLYAMIPVGISMLVLYLQKREYKFVDFFKANVYIIVSVLLLYVPIMLRNGFGALVKARGVAAVRSFQYVKENIVSHLTDTWAFLLSTDAISILYVPTFILLLLVIAYQQKGYKRATIVLMVITLLSPLIIIPLHRVIPFSRTWNYMIIPLALGIGMLLEKLAKISRLYKINPNLKTILVTAFVGIWSIMMINRSILLHRNMLGIDFVVREYVHLLKEKLPLVSKMDRTDDFSFYLAEDIQAELLKRKKEVNLLVVTSPDSLTGDILVVEKQSRFLIPRNYIIVPNENPYFRLYIRKDL